MTGFRGAGQLYQLDFNGGAIEIKLNEYHYIRSI